jgi:hypothetical protein
MILLIHLNKAGSCLATHKSFGAVKPVKAILLVYSINRFLPITLLRYAHSATVRLSFHKIAGLIT